MSYHLYILSIIPFCIAIAIERKTSGRPRLQLGRPFPLLHHGVYERPNPVPDPKPTIIAMLEYDGGLACESDAGGGSGEDDRAGFEVVAWERNPLDPPMAFF